jgi:4-hydroxythreonine-4-phosphate dehydrogenase
MSPPRPAPLAVTMGEPAGVGGEVTLKAWLGRRASGPAFFLIDDPERISALAETIGADVPVKAIDAPGAAIRIFADALPVLPLSVRVRSRPGELSVEHAPAVREAIERAVALTMGGEASAVVTNPIHKLSLYKDGFAHPGHTEYLAELGGVTTEPVMMLAGPELRVVPVTRHVSIRQAVAMLSADLIVETAEITVEALKRDFGLASPRLGVAALNPHAGEGGRMGTEESEIIEPAIARIRALGISASGPYPPDTMFHDGARKKYDAALCMYHDQGLIPVKTIDFDRTVNVTLGLPFIRTSPDHGTALDIAGTGRAREISLLAALDMAAAMVERRQTAAVA